MIKKAYQASINITKPKDEVFTFTSDPNNLPLWSGASEVEMVSEMADQVGSVYKVTFNSLLKKTTVLIHITGYTPASVWSFETKEAPISTSSYTFEEVEEGIRVNLSYIEEQEKDSLLNNVSVKRKLDNLLINLKKTLEK